MIDKNLVQRMADLAKLDLTSKQSEMFQAEFEEILEYMTVLEELTISTPDFTELPGLSLDSLRTDSLRDRYDRKSLLQNAPEQDGEMVIVPKALE